VSLPSLATAQDFETRYGASVDDAARLQALLDDASALARQVAGSDYVGAGGSLEAVPQTIVAVVCQSVRRAYDNAEGMIGENIGDYSYRLADARAEGVYLTETEERRIKNAAGKVSPTAFSVSTYGPVGYLGTTEDTDWS